MRFFCSLWLQRRACITLLMLNTLRRKTEYTAFHHLEVGNFKVSTEQHPSAACGSN